MIIVAKGGFYKSQASSYSIAHITYELDGLSTDVSYRYKALVGMLTVRLEQEWCNWTILIAEV